MRGSGSFFRGGSKYHYKRDIIGPPAKRQMACRCWPNIEFWLVSFVVLQGIRTNIAKKPYIFVIFQRGGGGPDPCPPSGSANAISIYLSGRYPLNPLKATRTARIKVAHHREMFKIRNMCNFAQVSLFVYFPHVFDRFSILKLNSKFSILNLNSKISIFDVIWASSRENLLSGVCE